MPKSRLGLVLAIGTLLWSCQKEKVPSRFYPRSDHEAYWYGLKQANLLTTALGKEWLTAANKPFTEQTKVALPYKEAFKIFPEEPDAAGYQFEVKRGQKVLVDLGILSTDSATIFLDLFRVVDDSLLKYEQVASADSTLQLGFEPRQDASYLLRLQPELLRGGDFELSIKKVPSLNFPVAGKDKRAIQSFFGDPRDGGRRDHHGVDIFARRHTPIIAPTDGYVRFVGVRGLGGKVIWLYDSERRQSLYFAHLQDQLVQRDTYVRAGDTIGTVGNSGNAIRTPPHLHFGIYKNGPLDPYFFISDEEHKRTLSELKTNLLGSMVPVTRTALVRKGMLEPTLVVDTLVIRDSVRVIGVNGQFALVRSKSGKGYLELSNLLAP